MEADTARRGISIVTLAGRHSGWLATNASLASGRVAAAARRRCCASPRLATLPLCRRSTRLKACTPATACGAPKKPARLVDVCLIPDIPFRLAAVVEDRKSVVWERV